MPQMLAEPDDLERPQSLTLHMNAEKSESRGVTKSLRSSLAALALICIAGVAQAGDWQQPPVNAFGAPIRDAQGHDINYSREELAAMGSNTHEAISRVPITPSVAPQGFVPAGGTESRPFWQYTIFGSGIGASNIIIGPVPVGGGAREIIIGGNSANDFGLDNFWQVIRHNSATGNYDQLFVSPISPVGIKRIAAGDVIGDSRQELTVLLADGRVFLYDATTRTELGSLNTGIGGIEGLSLIDLGGDGHVEIVVTTASDLFVFDNGGSQLWQVAGAGGYDVVVGQMDNDPALEIAATNGVVVDTATHTSQWTRSNGFGLNLALAPLPGSNYQQLIVAEEWYFVHAYDVATQLPRWSIPIDLDIAEIEVADVDNDGAPEVIVGKHQGSRIHVFDLITQAMKWETFNPEYSVTDIAVDDVDNDGVVDLIWGNGWESTGADHLCVARTTGNHAIKWQSPDLEGPVLGPLIGDLDGDGLLELVIGSFQSNAHWNGRILVFDQTTLTLRAMSEPITFPSMAQEGLRDLKLYDFDGDGRMEIVVASDINNFGIIKIFGFNVASTFSELWSNSAGPSNSSFSFVEVADLDGNGTPEIIAGTAPRYQSTGRFLYIYDYPSTTNPWRSPQMGTGFDFVSRLVVADLDQDGGKEIAALVSNGDMYTFDGQTHLLESFVPDSGGTIISDRRTPSGLIKGDSAGVGHFLQYSNGIYTENFTRQLGAQTLDGIHVLSSGGLWTGTGGALNLRVPPSYDSVEWQSPQFGPGCGRVVGTDYQNGQARVFVSARHAVAAYTYDSSLPPPTPTPPPTATPTPTFPPTPTPTPTLTPTPTPAATPATLGNISTRLRVETGDSVLIGGFIVTGPQPKRIIVRAIGPSLPLTGTLADPVLELRNSSGGLIRSNDNWREDAAQESEIIATGIPPANDLEAAIVETLPANGSAYTAIMRGANNGTGIGVVEVYDLDQTGNSKLANISTRGFVQTGDDVLIGGLIVLGQNPLRVIVRAIGPSLPLSGALADPTLDLHDGNGTLVASNNNWRENPAQESAIIATGIPPPNNLESAMVHDLTPGGYTAIVRGVNNTTGIAVVEAYALN